MELKDYQQRCLLDVKVYLEALADWKARYDKLAATDQELASAVDFPRKAWEAATNELQRLQYSSKKNGLGEHLPSFCLKLPTGGGKTLLASHTIGLINTHYLKKQTGLVLWIVPTTQIYRQTIKALRNREHPYRQILDINSGGRTSILEKTDRFTPLDIAENLVILLLMLPSANRLNKESLKIFQDASGFDSFFPPEDQLQEHEKLLTALPNLDYFGSQDSFLGRQIKTSLGNTLRLLKPLIVIDEGQKAYSENAQNTIRGFNPSIVLELSATPPPASNVLVSIRGQDLNREEMIKLDIHLTNKASHDWKDTLRDSIAKRNELHHIALEYQARTGIYIRPICLIQVERTGKDQIGEIRYIHAEEAKGFLLRECGVSPEQIAIKSSEKDDIEGIDLFSPDCPICYIITKQALQEGWDCSFAYILTVLTNPTSQTSITQLVGRILRQPYARKTRVQELDESYVFCFQQKANVLLESIRCGLQGEGLGDIAGNVVQDGVEKNYVEVRIREKFKKFEGKVYLPRFVIQEANDWREFSYEMDLLSRINWRDVNLDKIKNLTLLKAEKKDETLAISLSQLESEVIEKRASTLEKSSLSLDYVFVTRQILDVVTNPWLAFEIAEDVFSILSTKYNKEKVAENLVFIVEELRKVLAQERDRLAEEIFRNLIQNKQLCFFLQVEQSPDIPTVIKVRKTARRLNRENGDSIQLSLFDYVPEEELNETEKAVGIYLDEQEKLLWWYRNISRRNYYIQGWKKHRIYPDFLFTEVDSNNDEDCSTVYVLETKGLHLKNEDTQYKQNIFDICNELGKQIRWSDLKQEFFASRIEFQVIFENEWKRKINEIFG
ncbi:DEAD/DEAH box helicase family protein [Coleofasciculus sp. FACHB-542]|uniref:DEAD/DEAH box helicase n=1 Tax=Coleofasciculus sp. FACHB-542 TaxID=2692787 RepID=UPI001686BF4B|nr:DEAD/DEAH box helicase family protein [Coleofasciculus sp. FACHB-542]MBD2085145.1 DEAD/DEAH box helicase family protein [Coleofasciculus sp. FACHB-542]